MPISDAEMSMTISNELRHTDQCVDLVDGDDDGGVDNDDGGWGAAHGTPQRKLSVMVNAPNSSLPWRLRHFTLQ